MGKKKSCCCCYRCYARLLLRAHAAIHSSDYQDVLRLEFSVQQRCGGDLTWKAGGIVLKIGDKGGKSQAE